ncbi:MAG: helix-turn-helix transcriptional regulator [Lachnospiraceae bacterium]|nr:helix-turn-helix transcriptional regulator [Lachnospiraceae bacterium]
MVDKKLRKTIGERAKSRRKELGLTMDYVAERMDVNKSTIQRYESGTIDNSKKLVIEGLAAALHVTPEWLRGETDELSSDKTDGTFIKIEDSMKKILGSYPLNVSSDENDFSEKILLLFLKEYELFNDSFTNAVNETSKDNSKFASMVGFESEEEYNNMIFLREITHTINTLNDISDILRLYSKDPERAKDRVNNLLSYLL